MTDKNKLILGITSLIILVLTVTTIVLVSRKNSVRKETKSKTNKENSQNLDTAIKLISLDVKDIGSSIKITDKSNFVIRTKSEFDTLVSKINTNSILTESQINSVDFSKQMVIAVFQGEKGSGGYLIEIKNITELDDEIKVEISETAPGPNCINTSNITSPLHILTYKSSNKKVNFVTETTTRDCPI